MLRKKSIPLPNGFATRVDKVRRELVRDLTSKKVWRRRLHEYFNDELYAITNHLNDANVESPLDKFLEILFLNPYAWKKLRTEARSWELEPAGPVGEAAAPISRLVSPTLTLAGPSGVQQGGSRGPVEHLSELQESALTLKKGKTEESSRAAGIRAAFQDHKENALDDSGSESERSERWNNKRRKTTEQDSQAKRDSDVDDTESRRPLKPSGTKVVRTGATDVMVVPPTAVRNYGGAARVNPQTRRSIINASEYSMQVDRCSAGPEGTAQPEDPSRSDWDVIEDQLSQTEAPASESSLEPEDDKGKETIMEDVAEPLSRQGMADLQSKRLVGRRLSKRATAQGVEGTGKSKDVPGKTVAKAALFVKRNPRIVRLLEDEARCRRCKDHDYPCYKVTRGRKRTCVLCEIVHRHCMWPAGSEARLRPTSVLIPSLRRDEALSLESILAAALERPERDADGMKLTLHVRDDDEEQDIGVLYSTLMEELPPGIPILVDQIQHMHKEQDLIKEKISRLEKSSDSHLSILLELEKTGLRQASEVAGHVRNTQTDLDRMEAVVGELLAHGAIISEQLPALPLQQSLPTTPPASLMTQAIPPTGPPCNDPTITTADVQQTEFPHAQQNCSPATPSSTLATQFPNLPLATNRRRREPSKHLAVDADSTMDAPSIVTSPLDATTTTSHKRPVLDLFNISQMSDLTPTPSAHVSAASVPPPVPPDSSIHQQVQLLRRSPRKPCALKKSKGTVLDMPSKSTRITRSNGQ